MHLFPKKFGYRTPYPPENYYICAVMDSNGYGLSANDSTTLPTLCNHAVEPDGS